MKTTHLRAAIVLLGLCLLLVAGGCKKEYIHVGKNWDFIHKLKKSENSFQVVVSGTSSAEIGGDLQYTVTSEKDGKLWVVQVDPDDELSLLFPNEVATDNTIRAERPLLLPPTNGEWAIEASEPAGESVVVFVVTTGDVDIDDILVDENSMAKAMRIIEKTPSWGFARKVVEIH